MDKSLNRHSVRLTEYNYSMPGAYYITICTHERLCILGEIANDRIILSEWGHIIREEWFRSKEVRKEIELDEFIIMPNHLHGIIIINDNNSNGTHDDADKKTVGDLKETRNRIPLYRARRSLGSFISGFKSATTGRINHLQAMSGLKIWQRNYYEHIIRNDHELYHIREYIRCNPVNWANDEENPKNQ
jgi:REP element-mobilizing transposase RayT